MEQKQSKRGRKPSTKKEKEDELQRVRIKKSLNTQLNELASQLHITKIEELIEILLNDFLLNGDSIQINSLLQPKQKINLKDSQSEFYLSDEYFKLLFEGLYDNINTVSNE